MLAHRQLSDEISAPTTHNGGPSMTLQPPSTENVYRAIASLLRPDDGDSSERSVRCQLLLKPTSASYTVWVRSGIRPWISTALASSLGRPFEVSDDFWTLNREEVELLLSATAA
jgi:hypothetical protein